MTGGSIPWMVNLIWENINPPGFEVPLFPDEASWGWNSLVIPWVFCTCSSTLHDFQHDSNCSRTQTDHPLTSQWIPLWLSTQTIALTSGQHEEKYMKPSRPSALLSLQVIHHWKWTLPSGFHKLETYGLELMLLDCQAGLSLSSKHAESAKGICNSGTGDPNSIPIENYYICIYMYNWSSGAITLRSISYCTSWDLFVTFFCF